MRSAALSATVLLVGLLGILSIVFAGCGGSYEPPPPQPVGSPPSLSGEADIVQVVLSPDQVKELDVKIVTVQPSNAPIVLSMAGDVVPSPDAFAVVSAPISGRVARITVHEGEPVRRGQVVAYIESLEFASIVGAVVEAKARVDLNRSTTTRYKQLVDEGISPRARLLAAEAELTQAEAVHRAARARLTALGISDKSATELAASDRPLLPVTTPIGGLVDRHGIDLGQAVAAYDEMLTVVGSAEVLVRGLASPEQALQIKPGDRVSITPTSGGSGTANSISISATVTSVSPAVDSESRAVIVNIRTKPGGLRPGQPVRLSIETQGNQTALLLPIDALSYNGDAAVAFVKTGPETFQQRTLTLGPARTDSVPVLAGLEPGDEVAVSNVYDLKALARFEQYGEE